MLCETVLSCSDIGTKLHSSIMLFISAVQSMSCGGLHTEVDSSRLLLTCAMHSAPSVHRIRSKHAKLAATLGQELPRGSVSTTVVTATIKKELLTGSVSTTVVGSAYTAKHKCSHS